MKMRLLQEPFEKIKQGKKKIEIRCNDRKRQKLEPGDIITFYKLPEEKETIQVRVRGLLNYQKFKDLLEDFSVTYFGYPEGYSKQKILDSIYDIYSKEREKEQNVLGIRIELLSGSG